MAKINKSDLKLIIKEELLRLIKIGQLKELKGQLDEVRLYDSEERYDFGSYLSINRNDETGLLNFDFAPPGWNFETEDAAEAAAIIKGSQYKNDPKLQFLIAKKTGEREEYLKSKSNISKAMENF